MTLNQACYEVDWQLADDADNFDDPQEAIENDLTFQFGWPTKSRKPTLADGQEGHCGGGGPSTACPGAEFRTRGGCLPMSRRTHKARVTTSFALAHLAKEVVDEDWSATTAAFRLRVLVGENVAVLHRMRARLRRVATWRQDEPIRRALAILDVAVGKPSEVMPKVVLAKVPAYSGGDWTKRLALSDRQSAQPCPV